VATFAGLVGSSSGFARHLGTHRAATSTGAASGLPSSSPMRLSLIQDKQLPSGALKWRSDGESQRTRWPSRVSPMAGSWPLSACPKSYRPVSRRMVSSVFAPRSSLGSQAAIGASSIFRRRWSNGKRNHGGSACAFLRMVPRLPVNMPTGAGWRPMTGSCPLTRARLDTSAATPFTFKWHVSRTRVAQGSRQLPESSWIYSSRQGRSDL